MQINYNNEIRERFIPISYNELLTGTLFYFNITQKQPYQLLSDAIHKYYYCHFYETINSLQEHYQPFNPDKENLTSIELSEEEYLQRERDFLKEVIPLLNDANYEVLTQSLLIETMNKTSPYGVAVSVDFNDYEMVELHYRGESLQVEEKRDIRKLFLKKKVVTEPIYRRIFLILKPKQLSQRAKEIAEETGKELEKVTKKLRKSNTILLEDETENTIYIKLFKNMPQMDLQMLFPNTKVRMKLFDKVKLGVLGGGGTIGGLVTLVGKISLVALDPISALIAIATFLGVLWRQVKEVIFHRTHYMAELAKNLYFHNLDNNEGALNYVVNMAQEEESKEVLLTYIFLSQQQTPISEDNLDEQIERYVRKNYEVEMDFEVDDGVRKLRELGLLIEHDDRLSVVSVDEALGKLAI